MDTQNDGLRHSDSSAGRGTTAVSWIALIVAVVALALAWMAFDRTNDLEDTIQTTVEESFESYEQVTPSTGGNTDSTDDGTTGSGMGTDDTDTTNGTGTDMDQTTPTTNGTGVQ